MVPGGVLVTRVRSAFHRDTDRVQVTAGCRELLDGADEIEIRPLVIASPHWRLNSAISDTIAFFGDFSGRFRGRFCASNCALRPAAGQLPTADCGSTWTSVEARVYQPPFGLAFPNGFKAIYIQHGASCSYGNFGCGLRIGFGRSSWGPSRRALDTHSITKQRHIPPVASDKLRRQCGSGLGGRTYGCTWPR